MKQASRREFLSTFGAAGAFMLFPIQKTEPDLVLYNADFWTVNENLPTAEAVAISGDRFLAVGSNAEILALTTARSKKIDLGGKFVLPGFIDAHAHPAGSGVNHLRMVACDKNSIPAIQAALRERAHATPPGQWVLGFLYDDGKTPRPLNRHDLDEAVPDKPVMVRHRGGHTIFVNSMALKLAGVDDNTADPPGGHFDRDSAGHLTGHVGDNATAPFAKLTEYHPTRDDYRKGAALISKMFTSKGVTSACDAVVEPEALQSYQDARDAGELRMRMYTLIAVTALDRLIDAGIHTGLGDDWVKIGGVKQFADGSISERSAWLSEPYIGEPDFHGTKVGTREELYETSKKAHLAGWQLATHANGDLAIDEVLSVYEQIQKESPRRDARYRIEHCTLINESLVQRMKALNVIPVPFSCYVYFHGDVMHFYGGERLKHMFAMRTFLDAGLRPPDSSDYTASPSEPMMWLQSQITRRDMNGNVWGPNQAITMEEAIRCGTIHGAHASFEEHLKGSIQPGKMADVVVLGQNPFKTDPSELLKIPIERTMVGGKWMYES